MALVDDIAAAMNASADLVAVDMIVGRYAWFRIDTTSWTCRLHKESDRLCKNSIRRD